MRAPHFGVCPVCFIGNLLAVIVVADGTVRLECNSCWNQFSSPSEAQDETLEPEDKDRIRPATQVEIAGTGWHPAG